ncbi:hypothetical protein [Spirillospora sp. NPDC048823]|uniref:hypothetical protein n=1 Tax=unclassified Spirillospora TaxID=2642701 RepID=UPI00371AB364
MTARTLLRAGLAFLAVTQFGAGYWALFAPRSFFAIPWVGMRMPYNAHLMMDYGAMSLAISVALGGSALVVRRSLARSALAVHLVFAVLHLGIHIRLIHHLTPAERAPLLIALSTAVAITLMLLFLTTRLPTDA